MEKQKAFLTVDSGGSKTKLNIYDLGGALLADTTLQGFGTAIESEEEIPELKTALLKFCKGFEILSVVCNLGGRNKGQMRKNLKEVFAGAKVSVFRESEGQAGVTLCEMYDAEVTLMAGTGSIAVAPVEEEKIIISGGWGANISDKGSGYALGLSAVRFALEEIDGTKPLSMLTKKLTGLAEPPRVLSAEEYCLVRDKVRQNMAPLDRGHIASFAKTVYDCAVEGDNKALEIHKAIGKDLADIVIAAANKTDKPIKNVVVTGGMTRSRDIWQEVFEQRLKEFYVIEKVYYIADGIAEALKYIGSK